MHIACIDERRRADSADEAREIIRRTCALGGGPASVSVGRCTGTPLLGGYCGTEGGTR
jgi:hypothetical protein